jgi:hypothetical protein
MKYEAWEKERKMSGVVGQKLVRVCVEVQSDTARFRVGVQAEGIRRALSASLERDTPMARPEWCSP